MTIKKLKELNLTIKHAQQHPVQNTLTQMLVPSYFITKLSKHNKTMLELQNLLSIVDPHFNAQIIVPQSTDNLISNVTAANSNLQAYIHSVWLCLAGIMEETETNNKNEKAKTVKRIKTLLNTLARENELSCRITRQAKYAGNLATETLSSRYTFTSNVTENTEADEHEQIKARDKSKKETYNLASFFLSLIVGLGEGLVASALFSTVINPLTLLIVGLPAMIVNYTLFRGCAFDTLKELFLKQAVLDKNGNKKLIYRLYLDENGIELTKGQQRWVNFTLISSAMAGVCFGVLSFISGLAALPKIFGLIGLSALASSPIGIAIFAATIAIVTAICLTTLYYLSVKKLSMSGLDPFKKFFHENLNISNYNPDKDGTKLEFILKRILNWTLLAATAALSVVFTIASFGMFFQKNLTLVSKVPHLSNSAANIICAVITGLAGLVNTAFQIQSINSGMQWLKKLPDFMATFALGALALPILVLSSLVIGIPTLIGCKFGAKWAQNLSSWLYSTVFGEKPAQRVNNILNTIGYIFLGICLCANAYAQGGGGRTHDARAFVSEVFKGIGSAMTEALNVIALTFASFGATIVEILGVTKNPTSLNLKKHSTFSECNGPSGERREGTPASAAEIESVTAEDGADEVDSAPIRRTKSTGNLVAKQATPILATRARASSFNSPRPNTSRVATIIT